MNKRYTLLAILLSLLFTSCHTTKKSQVESSVSPLSNVPSTKIKKAKNVIFMVGDGMGLGQISAGMIANGYKLNLERFKTIGLHKSYAYNDLITDSAAGATAFACGVKTYNGAIGVTPDTLPTQSILEEAETKGLETGLVATSTIVHATPASFISHNKYRKNYEEIAADFLKTDIEVFIGGGKKFFDNRDTDERDLYQELRDKGYIVSDFFTEDLTEVKVNANQKFAYLTANDSPLSVEQGRDYLRPAAKKAISMLEDSEDGFFLMIEGSQIDWGGHANNTNYIVTEMIDFDKTVGEVLDWVEQDGETLLVITADHETGGFAINKGSTRDSLVGAFTSDYHTATMIPVFAYGPGAEAFSGIYENTSIYYKMREAFGWGKINRKY